MYTLSYHVVVNTPKGYRIGDIRLDIDENKIEGQFDFPLFDNKCYGILNEDDTFTFYVSITQEEKTNEYECTGRLSGYAIHISIPVDGFVYEVDGTTCRAK